MDKIKILYVITKCSNCGPINVLKGIVKNLDRDLFEPYLISISEEEKDCSVLEEAIPCFKEYIYVPTGKKDVALGRIQSLKDAILNIAPDVIHSNGIVPDLAVHRIARDRQLIVAHSNVWMDYPTTYGKLLGAVMARVSVYLFRTARAAVACSQSLSKLYAERGVNIPFIRNGVNVPDRQSADKAALRKQLGLPMDKRIFISASSFNPIKNLGFLIEMFSKPESDDVLLLLGDGPMYDEIKGSCHADNVLLPGRKMDVAPYLQASDFFISASLQEGMPMAVLEAMAQGLPVLLSDIVQHREIFELNPAVGRIFKNNDPESFMQNYRELVEEDYETLSENAYSTADAHFSSRAMSAQYQNYYSAVARGLSHPED